MDLALPDFSWDSPNVPVDGWDPGSSSPGAQDWSTVLQNGFSRAVDAITRPVQVNNTSPNLRVPGRSPIAVAGTGGSQPAGTPGSFAFGGQQVSSGMLILVVVALVAWKLFR